MISPGRLLVITPKIIISLPRTHEKLHCTQLLHRQTQIFITFIHKGIKYYVPTFIRDVKISFSNGSNIIQIFVFIVFLTCLFYTFFLDAKALYNSLITKNDYILNREVLKMNIEFVVFLCLTCCFTPSI